MLNIFNLFLFLFALWIFFMIAGNNISWLYIFFGLIASGFVAIVSFRLKLVEEKSELLYLSLGFYRHFINLFIKSFFSAIALIISLAISRKELNPTIHKIKLTPKDKFNPALLMASFNMSSGLFSIGMKDDEILVHAIDESYFKKFDLNKTRRSLNNANDDNLI